MNGLKPLLPFPTDDLATCIADIWVSILPPEKHSSYPSLPSPDTPMLAGWLLGLSLKGTSAHPRLPVSTPPNSSLAHKAQWGGSPLPGSSFLATPHLLVLYPTCLPLKTLVFSCHWASAHIPCSVCCMLFSYQIFLFSQGLTPVQNTLIPWSEMIALLSEL